MSLHERRRDVPDADIWVAPGVTAFTAPPGTPLTDNAAWKQIAGVKGASFVNGRVVYDKVTRDWMAANYVFPQRFITGIDPSKWDASIINERSKPVGLTKDHNYTDSDGDTITAQTVDSDSATERGATTLLCAGGGGTYVEAADSVPLALNVLGYDRMGKLGGFETTVGGYVSHGVLVNSQEKRDQALAIAVANLKSIDRYDQRADERRAAEEANAAALEAKEAARRRLNEAAGRISAGVVTDLNVDTLQIALADYKKAVDAVTKRYLDAF